MFSFFPPLLAFSGFAALLLRITLGVIFFLWGRDKYKSTDGNKSYAILEMLVGILLVIGYMTQFAAFISFLILGKRLIGKIRHKALFTNGVNYYFILFIISIALLFTGAGYIAFDLPL